MYQAVPQDPGQALQPQSQEEVDMKTDSVLLVQISEIPRDRF